jgi:hypothetical protein
VISHTTHRFRDALADLPPAVQQQAHNAFGLFVQNPYHPSLRFKQVHTTKPIFSVRIGLDYRAVGMRSEDEIVWFWIGSHADYDKLLKQL